MESSCGKTGLHLSRNSQQKLRIVGGAYARFQYLIYAARKSRAKRSAYGWLTDEVVLLPAVLLAAMCIFMGAAETSLDDTTGTGDVRLLNWLLLLASQIPLQSGIYFWSSLLWCGWYFYGKHRAAASPSAEAIAV
jgi:hypothetical protein